MSRGWLAPRLRAPVLFSAVGVAVLAGGGARYGWTSVGYLAPIVIAIAVGYYLLAGRDSDPGAVTRHQLDERLTNQRLRVQALVGRVLGLAVAVAYSVAVATRTMLWPYAVLLAVAVAAFVVGWVVYGEHSDRAGGADQDDAPHRRSILRR